MTQLWTAAALQAATGGTLSAPFDASGIAIDSRVLRPGEMFIALRGSRDGHAHIADAAARGACGAMVQTIPDPQPDVPLLRVTDTRAGLAALGAAGRARFGGRVVAVTGSVGKTTTKEMLRLCLSHNGAAHAAEASHNNDIGVPLTLARLPADAPACVVEIGMNHAGEIAPLARLAAPHVAVITTIGASHIGPLGSLAAIAEEKASIAAGLAEDGVMVVPDDTTLLDRLHAGPHRVLLFGAGDRADARLIDLAADGEGSSITASIAGQSVRFRLHAPGRHMALNALAALAATHAAGFDVACAAALLEQRFVAGAGRGARRRISVAGGSALLLDESYNAAAASVRAALAVLALQPAARRIAVLGDMRELGPHSAAEHRGLAQAVVASADAVFTCGPEMRALHEALPAALRAVHAETAEELAPLVAASLRPQDAVLVKGSNGSRMGVIVAVLDAARVVAA